MIMRHIVDFLFIVMMLFCGSLLSSIAYASAIANERLKAFLCAFYAIANFVYAMAVLLEFVKWYIKKDLTSPVE
jgi:hypothetical protein